VCTKTIAWHDNLPLVSFLLLRGRCRHCGAPIPVRYFLVELATAVFFLVTAATQLVGEEKHWGSAIAQAVFFAALLVCALVDWEHMIIPDEIDIPGFLVAPLVCGLVPELLARRFHLFSNERLDAGLTSIGGAVVGALLVWTIGWVGGKISRREEGAMGFGDVKFVAMIGGVTGWQGVLATLAGGSVVGSFYGVAKKLRGGDNVVPFGPFLAIGAAAFAFVGPLREWFLAELDVIQRIL